MDNYLLFKYDAEAEQLSQKLGFEKTFFLDKELVILSGNLQEISKKARTLGNKISIYFAEDDKKFRFVLEHTNVKMFLGMEKMFSRDSFHFPKSGLDQIFCKIAVDKEKILAFSINEVMNSKNPAQLLKRMAFNINLCKKYKVNYVIGNFCKSKIEMRSAADLAAFGRLLEKKKKI